MAQPGPPLPSISKEQLTEEESPKSSQDAMRTRVRLFAEGVVKMVSPVLLALALRKVDLKGEGTWFVRGSISPIAAVTMTFGILLMVLLWLCLSKLFDRLEWLQDAASKLLVHLCAILLMCLAYDILLLISMGYKHFMFFVIPLVAFVTFCYICSLRGDRADDAGAKKVSYDREMENSVDFSAAFTALLFLGLERLALEVHLHSNSKGMPRDHLESSLALSFVTCVSGVAIMFIWTIAPSIGHDKVTVAMHGFIEPSNVVLALLITGIVLWITWAPLKAIALLVIVPPLITLFCWIYLIFDDLLEQGQRQQEENHHVIEMEDQTDRQSQGADEQSHPQIHHQSNKNLQLQGCHRESIEPSHGGSSLGIQPRDDNQIKEHRAMEVNQQGQLLQQAVPQSDRNLQTPQGHHGEGVEIPQDDGNLPREDAQIKPKQDCSVVDINQQGQLHGDQANGQMLVQGNQQSDQKLQIHQSSHQKPQHDVKDRITCGVRQDLTGNNQLPQVDSPDAQPTVPPDSKEVKPPSLELTKFAFAGFLTVSIPSISGCSHSNWTHAFILLTAISVVSALVWRLLGHRANPKPPEVAAANMASTFAHVFAIAALIPFAVMADMNAQLIATPHCPT